MKKLTILAFILSLVSVSYIGYQEYQKNQVAIAQEKIDAMSANEQTFNDCVNHEAISNGVASGTKQDYFNQFIYCVQAGGAESPCLIRVATVSSTFGAANDCFSQYLEGILE